jgi:hypothetical protein
MDWCKITILEKVVSKLFGNCGNIEKNLFTLKMISSSHTLLISSITQNLWHNLYLHNATFFFSLKVVLYQRYSMDLQDTILKMKTLPVEIISYQ